VAVRIGINGFGRIGRSFLRAAGTNGNLRIVAVNDLAEAPVLAHLLKYDSIRGTYTGKIEQNGNSLCVNESEIRVLSEEDPGRIPWGDLGVDIVIESTGVFKDRASLQKHLDGGAGRVIVSALAQGEDVTVVMGVNEGDYDKDRHRIISNASCTTNCLALVAKVLNDEFGLVRGVMTTIHSYTNDQRVLDLPHSDLRRGRAASMSIIPTTTGAAEAVGRVLPELAGKLHGVAVRVPTPNVSVVDLVVELAGDTDEREVNDAFRTAARGRMQGVLACVEEPVVSIDLNGDRNSAIVDTRSSKVVGGRMLQVLSWYDNEWGYSNRLVDLIGFISA